MSITTSIEKYDFVRSRLNDAELLAGLAEEAAELSAAALKLRRAMGGSNPTPVSGYEAETKLVGEMVDVINYLAALRLVTSVTFCNVYDTVDPKHILWAKLNRWVERLGGESHD